MPSLLLLLPLETEAEEHEADDMDRLTGMSLTGLGGAGPRLLLVVVELNCCCLGDDSAEEVPDDSGDMGCPDGCSILGTGLRLMVFVRGGVWCSWADARRFGAAEGKTSDAVWACGNRSELRVNAY